MTDKQLAFALELYGNNEDALDCDCIEVAAPSGYRERYFHKFWAAIYTVWADRDDRPSASTVALEAAARLRGY